MCGISGMIADGQKRSDIVRMTDMIAHRGPDDSGIFQEGILSLGHRRLSIIDLSSDGRQPLEYMDRYVITYNGEIYNYLELRKELLAEGYRFRSQTDTEVILAAYDQWGADCVQRFNGMWAFAIYDRQQQILFCSRDRFGIKPFYYLQQGQNFYFGSEIKQLLLFTQPVANLNIVLDFLITGMSEHTEETFFANIYHLRGGHNLHYNLADGTCSIDSYYDLQIKKDLHSLTEQEAIAHYRDEFIRSIKLRLRSDVPVGTCLSGGLDSSSVAAIAAEYYNSPDSKFKAIHARSSEARSDESFYARLVAEHSHLDLAILLPSTEDFVAAIDDVVYTQEEPFASASIFMQYFVMKKAKEIGCKVLLDGQGGDETLLGYERYYPAYLLSLPFLQLLRAFFQSYTNSGLSLKQLIGYMFYFTSYRIRRRHLKRKFSFIRPGFFSAPDILKSIARAYLSIEQLQKLEIRSTQLPHLLRYEDKNSMRHSIEARLPFLDYQTVETALSINHQYKVHAGWTKYVLRRAVEKILPADVVWRKNKMGFEAPEKTWVDTIRPQILQAIADSTIIQKVTLPVEFSKLDPKTLWRFYSIARWETIYKVQLPESE